MDKTVTIIPDNERGTFEVWIFEGRDGTFIDEVSRIDLDCSDYHKKEPMKWLIPSERKPDKKNTMKIITLNKSRLNDIRFRDKAINDILDTAEKLIRKNGPQSSVEIYTEIKRNNNEIRSELNESIGGYSYSGRNDISLTTLGNILKKRFNKIKKNKNNGAPYKWGLRECQTSVVSQKESESITA